MYARIPAAREGSAAPARAARTARASAVWAGIPREYRQNAPSSFPRKRLGKRHVRCHRPRQRTSRAGRPLAAAGARLRAARAVRPADRLVAAVLAMRGAGCVYNDLVDAHLDRQVARTASRPVASGRVTAGAAWAWLLALCG